MTKAKTAAKACCAGGSGRGMKYSARKTIGPRNNPTVCRARSKRSSAVFRNVKGSVPRFRESFVNSGDVDMYRAMKLFKEVGYEGVFTDDHVPKLIDDTDWGHRSHAYAMGYIQALLDVVHA